MKEKWSFLWLDWIGQILDIVVGLSLTSEAQRRVRRVFESEMELGLARDPVSTSSLQMENTFLPELCDGSGEPRNLLSST